MARTIIPLCSERHYMGSSARGRFATDRSARPDYNRPPAPHVRAQRLACRPANRTRYLRSQHVVALVFDCHHAKEELAWGEGQLDRLDAALETALKAGDEDRVARIERVADKLRGRLEQTLAFRRELSRELHLIGITPKEQACILREARRRAAELRANPTAGAALD